MGLKSTDELVDLELAFDCLLVRHPEHGKAYKDLLNLWSDISRWLETTRDALSLEEKATLNYLISDEEQLRVHGAKKDELRLRLNCGNGDFHPIDTRTVAGMDKLKALLLYVRWFEAALGIGIWMIEFGERTCLHPKLDTLRNRLLVDIIPRYRKGNLYCARGKLVQPDVGTSIMYNYKGIMEIYWNNEGIFKAKIVAHDDGSFNLLDADVDLEAKFKGTRYDRR